MGGLDFQTMPTISLSDFEYAKANLFDYISNSQTTIAFLFEYRRRLELGSYRIDNNKIMMMNNMDSAEMRRVRS